MLQNHRTMKDSLAKLIFFAFVAWMAYGTMNDYTPSKHDQKVLREESKPERNPMWATYIILVGSSISLTFFIVFQSRSKRRRDKEFINMVRDEPGKIEGVQTIDDEAGKDIMVKKNGKIFMTMDTDKLKDL